MKKMIRMQIDKKIKEIGAPVWNSLKISIHPSLDFTRDFAVIAQAIPYSVDEQEKEILTIITSDRKLISLNSNPSDLNIIHYPLNYPRRWNLESIKSFIENKETKLDSKRLLKELKNQFVLYLEFPEIECYYFFPLWIIGTYLHPLFKAYPYVYVGGIKETGKTKVLNVCSCLSFNSIFSGNMSSASLFRLIQNNRCSLFIDESEKLSNPQRAEDFRNILLNGYKQGSFIYRVEKVKEKQTVMKFEPFSPKALANIQGLEDVLESRCIRFIMKRTCNKEVGEREVDENDKMWQILRDQLYLFSMSYWKKIKEIYDEIDNDTELRNRDWELWKSIFAIAKFIDPNIYKEMIDFALSKTKEAKDENITENTDYLLTEVLCKIALEPEESKFVAISSIKSALMEYFDDEPKWLNNKWIGRAVRRLGLKEGRRLGTHREILLTRQQALDLAKRLGISLENVTSQTSETTQTSLDNDISDVNDVSDMANSKEGISGENEV